MSDSNPDQASLDTFTAGTDTVEITRTVPLSLETSHTKTQHVQTAAEEFQAMCEYAAAVAPSFGQYGWSPQNNAFYRRITDEFDDRTVKATIAREAGQKVAEAFQSWRERGMEGDRPSFGDGAADYLRLSHQDVEIARNEQGWGLKASFIPYNPIWFGIRAGEYQREFLQRVTDGEARTGSGELYIDDGGLSCHLTISWEVEVYKPTDLTTAVGVDIGENVLYTAAVWDGSAVAAVEMESGREYRHHRERIKRSRRQASEAGKLNAVREARNSYRQYTDHITNVASREVVDLAVRHRPAVIVLEDLTDYRETADDAIHDWPFAEIQEKIVYKAREERLPAVMIDPEDTSRTCRQCGATSGTVREGSDFECLNCGYEVHADVNAAINIAQAWEGD